MIPVLIPATPLRPDYRPMLVDRLGGSDTVTVLVDNEMQGAWWNLHRCLLLALSSDFEVFATVHEDVYPVDDFQTHLSNAVASQPGRFFSGFCPLNVSWARNRSLEAAKVGAHWVYVPHVKSQCLVWTGEFARNFLEWLEEAEDTPGFWRRTAQSLRVSDRDDHRVRNYICHLQGLPIEGATEPKILATVPSLIQHAGYQSSCMNTLTGHFQHWYFRAQLFNNSLQRDTWSSQIYTPVDKRDKRGT